ncbi:hypothetical protein Tco_0726176 [Tanacetum coccineum]|uniref:Uncharacterized protein n=1 Tax=Tanacetum coccineum TaxID=301880 RepID=A0ABQ4YFQ8_9ASTR
MMLTPPAANPIVIRQCGGGGVGCGGTAAGEEGRVRESDLGDWVDPVTRIIFGVHRKTPSEKFSGGGDVVVAGKLAGEDEEQVEGTEDQTKEEITSKASQTSTQTPTSMIFGDDETIATLLLNMSQAKAASKEKEKGVELKDVEEIDRPRPTSTRSLLTLKPLPKIDPKDKGKKKIEEEDESESEDDDIPQAVKKFKQLESDEELARKIQEDWEAEEERNKIAEEKATNEALIKNFDDIKARIEADRILAEKLQEQEREQFTIEERAKFLHDTIAAQRKFLARQRSEAIRNRPPTKNQLRNQMMTYLKHVGNFKHSELKSKKFEDIQAMYEKIKRSDEDFIAIGSVEDDRLITKMNKKDSSKEEEINQESKEEVKEEDKEEENTRKRKHDEEKEVDYEILDRKYPIKEWKIECLGTKPQTNQAEDIEEINLNVVIRSNGQKRYFSTLMTVLSIFDREDLNAVYQLVMEKYQDEMPEGFDRVLWGDLMVLFNPYDKDEFWSSQLDWIIVSWKLHSSSGIHTLVTDTVTCIRLLQSRRVSHHSSDRHSSPDSSSSSSPSDHSLFGHTPPDTTNADSSTLQRFVHRSLARTLRRSEAFRRWRSAPLSTPYPPTTSESSLGSSSERSLDSSSPSSRPSRKRCRSPTSLVPSPTMFRGMIEIAASDVREDDEEFEAEASPADTREIIVDPLSIGDSSESSRGGIPDLKDTIYDIVHYMSDVRIDIFTKIETTQR